MHKNDGRFGGLCRCYSPGQQVAALSLFKPLGRAILEIAHDHARQGHLRPDNDPLLSEHAHIIAENDFALRAIHAQQVAVVERVREVTAIALTKGDNRLALAEARSLRREVAYDKLVALRDKLFQQYKDELPVPTIGYNDTRRRIVARLANVPPCQIGIETGMATHYVAPS